MPQDSGGQVGEGVKLSAKASSTTSRNFLTFSILPVHPSPKKIFFSENTVQWLDTNNLLVALQLLNNSQLFLLARLYFRSRLG